MTPDPPDYGTPPPHGPDQEPPQDAPDSPPRPSSASSGTIDEVHISGLSLVFDGRVLEFFGRNPYFLSGGYQRRYHVRQLDLTVRGPDRMGRYTVKMREPSSQSTASKMRFESDVWPAVLPFFSRVAHAVDARTSPPGGAN